MDSLLANYASDEEKEEEQEEDTLPASKLTVKPLSLPPPNPSKTSSLFSSLTSPDASKASSVFFSLPPPKSTIFSSLPPPKSHSSKSPKAPSSDPTPKRVIRFKPPLDPSLLKSQDSDAEDDEKPAEPTKETPSQNQNAQQKSLFSILPPPKNSLCLAPPRKSTVESVAPVAISDASTYISSPAAPLQTGKEFVANNVNYGNFQGHSIDQSLGMGSKNYRNFEGNSADGSLGAGNKNYGNYVNYGGHEGNLVDGSLPTSSGSYGSYENYGSYESNWGDGSGTIGSGPSIPVDSIGRAMGKRGRNETPLDIVEVKQDELMSNRPREDQVKLTGIAFGPSYQPVSSKGKPSKLHKRKHQIGSLYYDMKQKETELTERRARGFLTKAETQAKYGW